MVNLRSLVPASDFASLVPTKLLLGMIGRMSHIQEQTGMIKGSLGEKRAWHRHSKNWEELSGDELRIWEDLRLAEKSWEERRDQIYFIDVRASSARRRNNMSYIILCIYIYTVYTYIYSMYMLHIHTYIYICIYICVHNYINHPTAASTSTTAP